MAGCAHGHNCCETTFCECCPDSLRRKDFIFSVNDTNKTFKKSHCTQNKAQIAQLEECKIKNKTKRNKNQTCTAQIRV